jgi:ATP-binding cassette subfamily B protein
MTRHKREPIGTTAPENPTVLLQLSNILRPYRVVLLFALGLMLGESALSLSSPWFAGQFTRAFLSDTDTLRYSINQILFLWLFILAVQGLVTFGNRFLTGYTGEAILCNLRMVIYDHLQALPLSYFHERKRGDVLTVLTNDVDIVSDFFMGTLLPMIPQIFVLFGALFFIYLTDPTIALLIATFLPLFFLMTKILGRKIRPLTKAMIDGWSKTFSIAEENLQILPIIKSFNREKIESSRFSERNLDLFKITTHYLRVQSILSPLTNFVASAGILLLLWVGSLRLGAGQLAIDQLVSLLLYGMLLTWPIASLADVYGRTQRARASAERLAAVFATELEDAGVDKPLISNISGEIEFSNVDFGYEQRDLILQGMDFRIGAGETIAITGVNGAGKSTLAYLLQRFADPQNGKILIDGHDISQMNLSSLRSQIGVVSQQVLLLNSSVTENILFGRSNATAVEIESAARQAHAFDFIKDLPQGFDTPIGDEGIKLSGGQRQRLALARALLKDAPILILDEATAMFDPEAEKSFIEDCQDLLHQRTVILITHRPASLSLADRVLELKDGKMQATGKPETLPDIQHIRHR